MLMFFWRNSEACWPLPLIILVLWLLVLQEKSIGRIMSSERNVYFCLQGVWGMLASLPATSASLFLWKTCLFFSEEMMRHAGYFPQWAWHHHLYRRTLSASLRLPENTNCIILSSEKNQVPHYSFRQNNSPQNFLRKTMLAFSWRNNEAGWLLPSLITELL